MSYLFNKSKFRRVRNIIYGLNIINGDIDSPTIGSLTKSKKNLNICTQNILDTLSDISNMTDDEIIYMIEKNRDYITYKKVLSVIHSTQ